MSSDIAKALWMLERSMRRSNEINSKLRKTREHLETYYSRQAIARREFKNWTQTKSGKAFKHKLWLKQRRRCKHCHRKRELNEFHIDHIQPLSKYPEKALNPRNLQLLCGPCNLSKGAKEKPKQSNKGAVLGLGLTTAALGLGLAAAGAAASKMDSGKDRRQQRSRPLHKSH